jgi:hypothetical protein
MKEMMDNEYYIETNFKNKRQRLKYGLEKEDIFYQEWITNYEYQYGILIYEDGYVVDFYIPSLHINVDVKWKTADNSCIALLTEEVWLNKDSVDAFQTCQLRNEDYHHIFVVHIDTLGWVATNAKEIPTNNVILMKQFNKVAGSGKTMYVIPLRIFKPLDLFIKEGKWNGEHKFSDNY